MNDAIKISELLAFHDEKFIENAYEVILRRPVDRSGMNHYLHLLRSGVLRKFDIIVRLRLSLEGRRLGVHLTPFGINAVLSLLRQTPILGWLCFVIIDFVRLPYILRPIQADIADMRRLVLHQEIDCSTCADDRFHALDNRTLRVVNSIENAVEIFSAITKKVDVLEENQHKQFINAFERLEELRSLFDEVEKEIVKKNCELQDKIDVAENNMNLVRNTLQALESEQSNFESLISSNSHDLSVLREQMLVLGAQAGENIKAGINELRKEMTEIHLKRIEDTACKIALLSENQAQSSKVLHDLKSTIHRDLNFTSLPVYAVFDDSFAEDQNLVYNRYNQYLPVVESMRNRLGEGGICLDLGSGRGEWLRFLMDRGYQAVGVEINGLFVERARAYGMQVHHGDCLDYLRQQPSNSLALISAYRLIEHLSSPSLLVSVLEQCQRTLMPGGSIIIESTNIMNSEFGIRSFYADLSYRMPIVSKTLVFFVKAARFSNVKCHFIKKSEEGVFLLSDSGCQFDDKENFCETSKYYALTCEKV